MFKFEKREDPPAVKDRLPKAIGDPTINNVAFATLKTAWAGVQLLSNVNPAIAGLDIMGTAVH